MDSAELFGPPFTDLHDQGVVGVFHDEAPALVEVIERVNNNAMVA